MRRPPGSRRWPRGRTGGRGSSWQASSRSSSTRSTRPTSARPARAAGRVATPPGRAVARAVRSRVRAGQRSRRPWRVGASRRDRRRLPAIDGAPDPDRVLRRRDRLVALVRPDRPADDDLDRERGPAARLRVPPAGGRCGRHPRPTRAGPPRDSRNDSPRTSPASTPNRCRSPRAARRAGRWPSVTPPRSGPPTSPRRPASTTSVRAPCSCSTSPATSPRPPASCGDRPTSGARSWSRPASCRRTGRRHICRRATGRTGSWRLERSSSPGSRSRPRTRRWPAARSRRAIRSGGGSRSCHPVVPGDLSRPSMPGVPTTSASSSPRTRHRASPTSSARPATRSRSSGEWGRRRHPARSR